MRGEHKHKLTDADRTMFEMILARVSPSPAVYRRYLKDARSFISHFQNATGSEILLCNFELKNSILFGREYLIGHTSNEWFEQENPGCDATTSQISSGELRTFPLVIVPEKTRSSSEFLPSILEHEFVHVNQALE